MSLPTYTLPTVASGMPTASAGSSGFNISSLPNISGGLPTSTDLVPSVLFVALYAMLLAAAGWRAYTYRQPARLLVTFLRLTAFTAVRIATFSLRAVEAQKASSGQIAPVGSALGPFIAEQVLLGIGYIVLVDLVLELVKSHLTRTDLPSGEQAFDLDGVGPRWNLIRLVRLMRVALILAIILGVVAGTQFESASQSPSAASTNKTEKLVSSGIALAVTILCTLISLYLAIFERRYPLASSFYLSITSAILVIVPAYRMSSIENPITTLDALISQQTKIEFYVFQAAIEVVIAVLLLAVDVRTWFAAGGEEALKAGSSVELGRLPYKGVAPFLSTDNVPLYRQG